MPLSNKKEFITATCSNTDESQNNYAEKNKSDQDYGYVAFHLYKVLEKED